MTTDALTEPTDGANGAEQVAPDHDDVHGDGSEHGYTDVHYVIVAAVLAAITAVEIAVSYVDVGPVFLPTLLALMAIKFVVVVRIFMHLKFDSKIFSWMFFSGLFLALGVYVVMLAAFHFFTG